LRLGRIEGDRRARLGLVERAAVEISRLATDRITAGSSRHGRSREVHRVIQLLYRFVMV
jgi:hypothetical protein